MKESDLQKQILKHLNKIGILAWRSNTGAFAGEYKGKKRFVRFGIKGMGDIFGIDRRGRFISIECKSPGKFPTDAQLDWIERVNQQGGIAYWCGSWETWVEICEECGWLV